MAGDAHGAERFVWPPVAAGGGAAGSAPTDAPAARGNDGLGGFVGEVAERPWLPPGRWARWVAQVESAWVGREPTIAERLEAAGWQPDDRGLVCPRCASDVGRFEADVDGCPACRERRLPWREAIRLGAYEGALREGVLELKFGRRRATGRALGEWLGLAIAARRKARGLGGALALVPIPPGFRRRLSRGVDHTAVLATAAGRVSGGRVAQLLKRPGLGLGLGPGGRPQTAFGARDRERNMSGAFRPVAGRVRGEAQRGTELVVLLDDVRTTGATLRAAGRTLARATRGVGWEPMIWVAVVGVTPAADRRGRGS